MKTINVIKKVFISTIVLTMVMAFAFGFNVIVKAAPNYNYLDELAIEGVGIRTNGNQGMRFKVTVDDTLNEFNLYLYGNARFGVVIAYGTTDTSIELNMTINDKKVISGEVTQLDGDNCYYITLYNIPNTEYMQNISVRPYISYWDGYIYGNETKVYNLTTVAYKAMNDGIESTLLTDVDTYMNANYKKVYVDEFDNLVFDGFKETNPEVLKEQFINDLNKYQSTTLTINSSVNDWVTQLQYNTDITDSNLYQAYKNTKFNNKWSWLFEYLGNYGHIKTNQQVSRLGNNVVPGTDYNNFKNLIYSLYNFFNCEALDTIDSIPFNTESAYSTLTTSNIYPEIEDYDIRKVGTTSVLGHKDEVIGYTLNNWVLNSTDYSITDTYTVPSDNVKFTSNKTCHITYTISNKVATVTGLNTSLNITDLVIPSKCGGYSVTTIKASAFSGCTTLTSVTIPASVTNIGSLIFENCTNLTSITVDSNNNVYDSRDNCNAIIFTSTNTLSYGCKNTVIPNTVTNIGVSAFKTCTGLTAITIPNSVTSIGASAFYGCTALTTITIPNSVTSIGGNAFNSCNALTSITLSNTLTSIGHYVFYNCSSLTSITIPNTVKSIGQKAFYQCTSLATITIPNSVTSIGEEAFNECTSLTSIIVDSNNTAYDSRNNCNAIIETATNTLIKGCINTVIPNTVTSIGEYAFYKCSGLTSITIPDSVLSIGKAAFCTSTSLTSITFSNTLTSIGASAFASCYNLSSVTIPDTVKSIGEYAFAVTAITNITIPSGVTSIEYATFLRCTNLESVVLPNTLTSIGRSAFDGCSSLTSVVIPFTVTSMGRSAFLECTSLTIYCEATSQPSGWDSDWNKSNRPVTWNYK